MFQHSRVALFFFVGGLYLFTALVSYTLDNFLWIHASQAHVNSFVYFDYLFYFLPTMSIYFFGLISTWYLMGYCFFVGYMLFYYPVNSIIDRIIAGGLNIVLINLLLSMQTVYHSSLASGGGLVGYVWYNTIKHHYTIANVLVHCLLIVCFTMVMRFSWIFFIYTLGNNLYVFLQKMPIVSIQKAMYVLYLFSIKPILASLHKWIFSCKKIVFQKLKNFPNQICFSNYKNMLHDIGNYIMISFEEKNNTISAAASVDFAVNSEKSLQNNIMQSKDHDLMPLNQIKIYESIQSLCKKK
jgi:hypothetical protein